VTQKSQTDFFAPSGNARFRSAHHERPLSQEQVQQSATPHHARSEEVSVKEIRKSLGLLRARKNSPTSLATVRKFITIRGLQTIS
jgi:hypothetical protein